MKAKTYERKSKEPIKAYKAFCEYLLLPSPRSVDELPQNGVPREMIDNYFIKWNWQKRADAYDLENQKLNADDFQNSPKRANDISSFDNKFRDIILALFNKMNKLIDLYAKDESKNSIDEHIKLIGSLAKLYNETKKIIDENPPEMNSDFNINDLILQDVQAVNIINELIEYIAKRAIVEN